MIVYLETNFILEISYQQEEYAACLELLELARQHKVELYLPAMCFNEAYFALERKNKSRKELIEKLEYQIRELQRSQMYNSRLTEVKNTKLLLTQSLDEDKENLDQYSAQILALVRLIPFEADVFEASIKYQNELELPIQDAIVYACVQKHMPTSGQKCFITKNKNDFDNPDIRNQLTALGCKMLFQFKDGLGYIKNTLSGV